MCVFPLPISQMLILFIVTKITSICMMLVVFDPGPVSECAFLVEYVELL